MTNDYYIGVDGGGTKCKVRVEDANGHLIGQGVGGPANIRLSVDKSWESILSALDTVLNAAHLSLEDKQLRFHMGLGLAGCEVESARAEFLKRSPPFASICLDSDAYAACLGAHNGADGAIIIVGTGVVGYQIWQGQTAKIGGWGFPHGDEGGGAWLGLEATRLTLHWLDGRIEATPLLINIFQSFNNDLDRLVTWANQANSTAFAKLAPIVINHVQKQDPVALSLIKQAAKYIDEIAAVLQRKALPDTPETAAVPCCLFGGIAPFIEPWLNKNLHARLVPRQHDANVGAILMVRRARGIS